MPKGNSYTIKNESLGETKAPNQVKGKAPKAEIMRGGDLRAGETGGKKAKGAY